MSAATAVIFGNTPTLSFTVDATGTGFVAVNGSTPGSQITVNGKAISSQFVSATEVTGVATAPSGTTSVAVAVQNSGTSSSNSVNVALNANPPVSATAAARFLDQATFGPSPGDISTVENEGFLQYLSNQFATPMSSWPAPLPANGPTPNCPMNSAIQCMQRTWLYNAVAGADQVRQRMAFALQSIWVISSSKDSQNIDGYAFYLNTVNTDALSNWRTLMQDVTLTPDMGFFLDMLNSGVPTGPGNIANENYGREFMQLFNIGLYDLNLDGTQQLDTNGNPIPPYTQTDVETNARAFTGWTLASGSQGSCQTTSSFPNGGTYDCPMTPVLTAHDTSAKTLLGAQQAAGQDPLSDLNFVMNTVFNHPNVGPFISRQLIEHLVESNPSPQYVARVATVFNNDGTGTRGNLQAVLSAILLDPEARAGDSAATEDAISNTTGGHLSEPVLYVTRILRALGASATALQLSGTAPDYSSFVLGTSGTSGMGENLLGSFSVFNFFPPAYEIPLAYTPGRTQALQGPEFALESTGSIFVRYNFVSSVVSNSNNVLTNTGINLGGSSPTVPATCSASTLCTLAQNDINAISTDTLLDTLNLWMMHDQMPKDMYSTIDATLKSSVDAATRVRLAVYLIATSSQYMVIE